MAVQCLVSDINKIIQYYEFIIIRMGIFIIVSHASGRQKLLYYTRNFVYSLEKSIQF